MTVHPSAIFFAGNLLRSGRSPRFRATAMPPIAQLYYCHLPGQVFGWWFLQCRLRIYQPHPALQIVVISDMSLASGRFIPYQAEALAHLIVSEFHLNPQRVIWLEHYSPGFARPTCPDCSLVSFEWQGLQPSQPQRVALNASQILALVGEPLQGRSPVAA